MINPLKALMKLRAKLKNRLRKLSKFFSSSPHFPSFFLPTFANMTTIGEDAPHKATSILKVSGNLMHRFVVILVRTVMRFLFGTKGGAMPPIKDLNLLESATSLARKIRTGKVKSVDVVQSFIDRINEINPVLNCVVDRRFEDALRDAAAADKLIASGEYSQSELERIKPFLGVPITTKDCISVKGMLNTAGIVARRNTRAEEDSEAIQRMRDAGAIPLAITNTSECCMWWESYNNNHGKSCNPYDTNRTVGGSSGGEGCLLSSGGSPFGIGSDIGGSIRMPSFFNGIFGHKPSKFIVSLKGHYPIPKDHNLKSFLGVGPMSRYATDLLPMLKILAGENASKMRLDEPVDLTRVKIFYQTDDGGGHLVTPVDPDIKAAIQKVATHFQSTLKAKVQKVRFDKLRKSAPIWFANMKAKDAPGFDQEITGYTGKISPPVELVRWMLGRSNHTLIGIMTALFENFGVKYGDPKQKHLVQQKEKLFAEMQDLLGDDGVFIYPAHPTPAPYHYEPLVRALNFSYTGVINVLGLPATACPLGLGSEGLPIGLQVVSAVNQDRLSLAVACELERVFGGWVAPEIQA
ncbi:fatty-acid amide hydrolase 2-A [Phlebotomus argentipes]|uniref:fatty-acid amide hydrolase 2-A n=1 Tax=Phlebotomus argentipes TaxID=94469 RepID=UPI002892B533|nr:fatty-acid amide hydrolase 2-A [Phlebotomus argentipes]